MASKWWQDFKLWMNDPFKYMQGDKLQFCSVRLAKPTPKWLTNLKAKSCYCVHTFKSHYTPFCPPHLLSIARPSQITQEVQRCLGHGYDLVLNLHIALPQQPIGLEAVAVTTLVSVCRRRMGTWRPKWCVSTDAETSPQRSSPSRISMHVSSCERLLYP